MSNIDSMREDGTMYVTQFPKSQNKVLYNFGKRTFDIVVSFVVGIILLGPMAVVSLMIKMDSEGPAIFKQERVGKYGKTFYIYKFRTMNINAPSAVASRKLIDSEEYITRIGHVLRKTSFDEVPQLLNIFKGDMSFVGYRPVVPTERELNRIRAEYGVLKIKPGLTGLAQVSGRDNLDYKEKAKIDSEYVHNMSFVLDLYCIIKTVKIVITGEGVK